MKEITNELHRVCQIIENIGGNIYLDKKYKNDLEWWVLGKISKMLKKSGLSYSTYAEKSDHPDFITFDNYKSKFKKIEITEVIHPIRKRSDEYVKNLEIIKNVSKETIDISLWETLKTRINDKLLKFYGSDIWLFIYFNINYGQISHYGFWHRALMTHINNWIDKNEINMENNPYERIYVTNCSANALVQIHPLIRVIFPEQL